MLSTSLLSTTFPGAGVVPYPGPAATLPLNQHYVNAHSQHYSQPGYATSSATDAGLAPHALMSQANRAVVRQHDICKTMAVDFFSIFVKPTGNESDIMNKRDVWAMYYAIIPHHWWLDHSWLGRVLSQHGIPNSDKSNARKRKGIGGQHDDDDDDESHTRCKSQLQKTEKERGKRNRDLVPGYVLQTDISLLDHTQEGRELKARCQERGVNLDAVSFEGRLKIITDCIGLFYMASAIEEFRLSRTTLRDMLSARLGYNSRTDLNAISSMLYQKTLVWIDSKPLVKYRQSHYLPVRVLQGDTYLQIQFDLFGNLTLDTLQSHSIGNNIYLIFKKEEYAPYAYVVACILNDHKALPPGGYYSNHNMSEAVDEVFIHVIVPKGYDYQRVEYHFGEEKLLLNLPLMTPAEAKAQTFADPSAITRVAPITLSPNPNPHPKLSSLAPPNGFPQAGAKERHRLHATLAPSKSQPPSSTASSTAATTTTSTSAVARQPAASQPVLPGLIDLMMSSPATSQSVPDNTPHPVVGVPAAASASATSARPMPVGADALAAAGTQGLSGAKGSAPGLAVGSIPNSGSTAGFPPQSSQLPKGAVMSGPQTSQAMQASPRAMTPAMAQALQQSQMLQASQDPLPQSLMDVTADVTKGLAAGLVGASNYMLGTPEALRNQDALAKGQVQGLMPDRDSVFSFVDSPTGSSAIVHTTDSLSSANLLLNGDSLSIPLPFDDSNGPSPGRYTPTPQLPPLTGKMSPTPPMSPSGFSLGLGDGLMEMAELPHDMIASPVPVPKTPTSLSYLPGEHSPDWAGMLAKLKDSPSPSPSPSYLPRPKRQMVTTPLARRLPGLTTVQPLQNPYPADAQSLSCLEPSLTKSPVHRTTSGSHSAKNSSGPSLASSLLPSLHTHA